MGWLSRMSRSLDGVRVTHGVPVAMPELEGVGFVCHRALNDAGEAREDAWKVTERATGLAAGHGRTAEEAILDARTKIAQATPERLAAVRAQIAAAAGN